MDARARAAPLLERIRQQCKPAAFAYGTPENVHVLIGAQRSLAVQGPLVELSSGGVSSLKYTRRPDLEVRSFLEANFGAYMGFYLGYDLHYVLQGFNSLPMYRSSRLVVPETVIRIKPDAVETVSGSFGEDLDLGSTCMAAGQPPGYAHAFENAGAKQEFERRVRVVLNWISAGGGARRCTIARKVALDSAANLAATFAVGDASSPLSRSYYFSGSDLTFVGASPELLFEGNARLFRTHKLSGTLARSSNQQADEALCFRLMRDGKLQNEHELSVQGMERALRELGKVRILCSTTMTLSNLRHRMTSFETACYEGRTLGECLLAILPTGVSESQSGLPLIAEAEAESRGAYYGVVGLIQPDGSAECSQNLRTIYRYQNRDVAWVGAGITSMSVPETEYEETCLKLANICFVKGDTSLQRQ
jgi:salicylate synthetase